MEIWASERMVVVSNTTSFELKLQIVWFCVFRQLAFVLVDVCVHHRLFSSSFFLLRYLWGVLYVCVCVDPRISTHQTDLLVWILYFFFCCVNAINNTSIFILTVEHRPNQKVNTRNQCKFHVTPTQFLTQSVVLKLKKKLNYIQWLWY